MVWLCVVSLQIPGPLFSNFRSLRENLSQGSHHELASGGRLKGPDQDVYQVISVSQTNCNRVTIAAVAFCSPSKPLGCKSGIGLSTLAHLKQEKVWYPPHSTALALWFFCGICFFPLIVNHNKPYLSRNQSKHKSTLTNA